MIIIALLLASPLSSLQSEAPVPAPAATRKPQKEKKICRSVTKTGSRVAESQCHTATEWQQIDNASGVDPHDMQQMQSQMNPH